MSCVIGKWDCTEHVGYKGQRYEVRARGKDNVGFPVGWTDEEDGGQLAKAARLNPSWTDVRVVDLGTPSKTALNPAAAWPFPTEPKA